MRSTKQSFSTKRNANPPQEYRYVHVKPLPKPQKEYEIQGGTSFLVSFGEEKEAISIPNGDNTMRIMFDDYLNNTENLTQAKKPVGDSTMHALLSTFAPIILQSHGAASSERKGTAAAIRRHRHFMSVNTKQRMV